MSITEQDYFEATGEKSEVTFSVEGLDLAGNKKYQHFITFIDTPAFIEDVNNNPNASVIIATNEISGLLDDFNKVVLKHPDPRWAYFSLQNLIAKQKVWDETVIHPTAVIHPSASVSPLGVVIEEGVTIEANCTIHASSIIKKNAVIRSNAVIGTIGFEHKRTTKGVLSVEHDGTVTIGEKTEIGSNSIVAQGYLRRPTIIGNDVRIDGNSFIAHGVWIGDETFIAAGVSIAGSTTVGNKAWIGLGALVRDQISIGEGAKVNIGAVVVRDVPEGASVLGNPAKILPS